MRSGIGCCMPRVVENQRDAMTRDPILSSLTQQKPVRYAGAPYAPNLNERQERFNADCRDRKVKITYPENGIQLDLPVCRSSVDGEQVNIESRFIYNGVCVIWRGSINVTNLDGTGYIQLDVEKANEEEARMREEQRRVGQRLHNLLMQLLPPGNQLEP